MASIISYEEVVKIVTDVYGFNDIHKIRGLGSCQDINFRIDVKQPNEGSNEIKSYILKISNLDTTMEYIQFQNSILMHLNSVKGNKSNLQFPNLVSTINDNEFITSWKIGEDTYFIRCFTFVHGIILSDCGYLSLDVYEKLGALCYQVDNLLKGVDIPDAEEFLSKESNESGNDKQWDMQFALKNLEQYISILVPTPSLDVMMMHSLLRQAYHCQYLIERYLPYLSKQVIHGDLAYYNLVAAAADVITPSAGQSTGVIYGRPTITGVIDFGDCTYSWLIGELCVAITPLLVTDDQDPVEITCAVLRGFLSASAVGNTVALTDGEVFSLWPLIIQRAIMLNIFIAYQLQVDPANQYCAKELVLNRRLLEKVLAVPMVYAQTSLHHVLLKVSRPELLVPPTQLPVSMLALEGLTSLIHIDPSVTSALFQERFWHENIAREDVLRIGECAYDLAGIINRVWIAVSSEGISNKKSASGLMLAYGVPQFYRTMPLCHSNPRTIPLGVTFFLNQLMLPAMWFKMRSNGRICEVPNLKTNDTSSTNSTSPYDPFLEMSLSISSEIRLIRIENCPYDILLRAESKLTMVEKFSRPTKMQKTKGSDVSWEPLEAGDKIIIKACSSGSLGSPLVHLQMVSRSLAELLIDPSGAPQLPPLYCSSTEFETWRTLCPDPCLFLQVPGGKCQYDGNTFQAIDSPDHGVTQGFSDTLTTVVANCTSSLQSRKQYAANAQEYYYSNTGIPPFIERGFKQYLFDISGRSYLDMVNNVAIVGHSREAIKSAVQKQMTLLNTNSRFVYTSFGEFCEQVVSKLSHIAPNHWSTTTGWRVSDDDNGSANKTATTATSSSKSKESIKNHWQVFVVNSGSEAVDLALRIARTVVTERRRYLQGVNCTDIDSTTTDKVPYELQRHTLCFGGGYHGVTTSSDEVSTTLNDNPRSLDSRPHWIHLLPLPNMYRGKWRCGSYGRSVDINMETALILKQERVNLGRQYAGKYCFPAVKLHYH